MHAHDLASGVEAASLPAPALPPLWLPVRAVGTAFSCSLMKIQPQDKNTRALTVSHPPRMTYINLSREAGPAVYCCLPSSVSMVEISTQPNINSLQDAKTHHPNDLKVLRGPLRCDTAMTCPVRGSAGS